MKCRIACTKYGQAKYCFPLGPHDEAGQHDGWLYGDQTSPSIALINALLTVVDKPFDFMNICDRMFVSTPVQNPAHCSVAIARSNVLRAL